MLSSRHRADRRQAATITFNAAQLSAGTIAGGCAALCTFGHTCSPPTLSIHVEVADPVGLIEKARADIKDVDPEKIKPGSYVKVVRLSDNAYRFAADFALREDREVKENPITSMMLAKSYVTLSVSGIRVETLEARETRS